MTEIASAIKFNVINWKLVSSRLISKRFLRLKIKIIKATSSKRNKVKIEATVGPIK